MAVRISLAVRNAALNGGSFAEIVDGESGNATLELYTGSVHASFGTSPSGTKLATLTMDRPSFDDAASGSMSANPVQSDISANATGTIGCFVLRDPTGAIHADGSVTATGGGGDVQFDSVSVTAGDTVAISALLVSIPQS